MNRYKNLHIIPGNVINTEDIEACITSSNLVVLLIGHDKNSPLGFQTKAVATVLGTLKKHGISRIISLTGGGVRDERNDQPGLMDKFVVFF